MFHASLLRIHVPNDDWLFPGRLDTQLGNADGTEGEWAIDSIIGHAGLKNDATFEVKWKMGDITWLPHYQVNHLNALQLYFDLLGIGNISQLLEGKGKLPSDDPQTFIGNIGMGVQPVDKRRWNQRRNDETHTFIPSSIRHWLDQFIRSFHHYRNASRLPSDASRYSSLRKPVCNPCGSNHHVCLFYFIEYP